MFLLCGVVQGTSDWSRLNSFAGFAFWTALPTPEEIPEGDEWIVAVSFSLSLFWFGSRVGPHEAPLVANGKRQHVRSRCSYSWTENGKFHK